MSQAVKTLQLLCSIYRGLAEAPSPVLEFEKLDKNDPWPLTPVIVLFVDLVTFREPQENTQNRGKEREKEKKWEIQTQMVIETEEIERNMVEEHTRC